jgi:hypothetical protein
MKPINSVISGLVSRAQADANSIGPQHGGRGVATVAVLAKLESQSPAETDRNLLAWLESSLNVAAKPQSRMMFPPEGGFYRRTTGFQVSGLTPENRETARQAVQSAMTRPPLDKCEEWVAGLHAVTARRGDDTATLDLTMSLYAACLAKYPADVAKQACLHFAMRSAKPNWFPTLSELAEWCERETAQRQQLLDSLQK